MRGEELASPCEYCLRGHGPIPSCVIVIKDGTLLLKRTCPNDYFNGDGTDCTSRKDKGLPRLKMADQALTSIGKTQD